MYQMEKITTGVSYTSLRWGRDTGFCSCWTGYPRLVGGNRRAGESAVWSADVPDHLYFKIREDRRKAARGE